MPVMVAVSQGACLLPDPGRLTPQEKGVMSFTQGGGAQLSTTPADGQWGGPLPAGMPRTRPAQFLGSWAWS